MNSTSQEDLVWGERVRDVLEGERRGLREELAGVLGCEEDICREIVVGAGLQGGRWWGVDLDEEDGPESGLSRLGLELDLMKKGLELLSILCEYDRVKGNDAFDRSKAMCSRFEVLLGEIFESREIPKVLQMHLIALKGAQSKAMGLLVQQLQDCITFGFKSVEIQSSSELAKFIQKVADCEIISLGSVFDFLTERVIDLIGSIFDEEHVIIVVEEHRIAITEDVDLGWGSPEPSERAIAKKIENIDILLDFIVEKVLLGTHKVIQMFFTQSMYPISTEIVKQCFPTDFPFSVDRFIQISQKLLSIELSLSERGFISTRLFRTQELALKRYQSIALSEIRQIVLNSTHSILETYKGNDILEHVIRKYHQIHTGKQITETSAQILERVLSILEIPLEGVDIVETVQKMLSLSYSLFKVSMVKSMEIPQIPLLFSNDCHFIAFALERFSFALEYDFMKTCSFFRFQSEQWVQRIRETQYAVLRSCIDDLDHFDGILSSTRDVIYYKGIIDQVVYTLSQLQTVFRQVLPLIEYQPLLHAFIAQLFSALVEYIKAPSHISLKAANSLYDILDHVVSKTFDEFPDVSKNTTFRHLSDVKDLLAPHQTLKDISKGLDHNQYASLSSAELKSLIVALFEASPKRDEILLKISHLLVQ